MTDPYKQEEEKAAKDLEESLESGEINSAEQGFIQGYKEGKNLDNCPNCGQAIVEEDFIEEEINGRLCRFCSSECADEYEKKTEKTSLKNNQ